MRSRGQRSGWLVVRGGRSRRLVISQLCGEVWHNRSSYHCRYLILDLYRSVFILSVAQCSLFLTLMKINVLFSPLFLLSRYDPKTNQWSSDVAPTSTCRTSVGVAVLGGYLYAVGGQDGVSCLNIVERYRPKVLLGFDSFISSSVETWCFSVLLCTFTSLFCYLLPLQLSSLDMLPRHIHIDLVTME